MSFRQHKNIRINVLLQHVSTQESHRQAGYLRTVNTFYHLQYSLSLSLSLSLSVALRPNAGHGLHILEVSRSHTTTHHSR